MWSSGEDFFLGGPASTPGMGKKKVLITHKKFSGFLGFY